jgi:hypothetical protein
MKAQTKEVIINKSEILKYIIKKSLSEDVNVRGRVRLLIEARFIYFYILRNTEKMVYQKIGDTVGMNHASVLHGCIKAGHWIDLDYKFKDKYLTILATYSREVYGAKAEAEVLKNKQTIKPPEEYIQVEDKRPMKRIATVYTKLHTLIDKTPEDKADDLLVRVEAIFNMMQSDLKRKRV